MDELRQSLSSGNIVVWIIAIVVLVLVLKFLKSIGKMAIWIVFLLILGLIFYRFAPDFVDSLAEFVKGGWLAD